MYCVNCGKNSKTSDFCSRCGAMLQSQNSEQTIPSAYSESRRYSTGRIIFIVVVFLCVFLSVFWLFNVFEMPNTRSSGSNGSNSSGSNSPAGSRYGQGEVALIGDFEMTLVEVKEIQGNNVPNEFKPGEGNVYLLVYFEIKNTSTLDQQLSTMLQFTAYVDNYITTQSIWAKAIEIYNSGNFVDTLDTSIASGRQIVGSIGYEVPKDWKLLEIEFTPNAFNVSQKAIFQVENPNV